MILQINWQELMNSPIVMISPLIFLAILFIVLAIVKEKRVN